MRSSLFTVILAMASALVTVAAVELLRGPAPLPVPVSAAEPRAGTSAPPPSRGSQPLAPVSAVPGPGPSADGRIQEDFGRRLLALEQAAAFRRTQVSPPPAPADDVARADDLRALVLEWVATERETRQRVQEREREQQHAKELEFGTRMQAHIQALEHGLAEWEEGKLAAVLLEIEIHRGEIEGALDPLRDDPVEAEQRFIEFDLWAERRMEEELGLRLVEQLFGAD